MAADASPTAAAAAAAAAADGDGAGWTAIDRIARGVSNLREAFPAAGWDVEKRKDQIRSLQSLLADHGDAFAAAAQADLGRPPTRTHHALQSCVAAAKVALKRVDVWSSPRPYAPASGNRCEVRSSPRGVVLIVCAWTELPFTPLISALAAGNSVLLNVSEVCQTVSALHAELIANYLDPKVCQVVAGFAQEVLKHPFDAIFYSGNRVAGQVVMRAAAEHLCHCVIEVSGKNPTIVAADADLRVAARKIVDGRFQSAGQCGLCPDYVLVERGVCDALVAEMVAAVREFFGDDPKASASYARLVSAGHTQRVIDLLGDAHGGTVAVGGDHDASARYVGPTVVVDPDRTSQMLSNEIMGPILPVKPVDTVDVAIAWVNARPRPRAVYIFSSAAETSDRIVDRVRCAGGACVNDVMVHVAGSYSGTRGFLAFSHEKPVMTAPHGKDAALRFPPFGNS